MGFRVTLNLFPDFLRASIFPHSSRIFRGSSGNVIMRPVDEESCPVDYGIYIIRLNLHDLNETLDRELSSLNTEDTGKQPYNYPLHFFKMMTHLRKFNVLTSV